MTGVWAGIAAGTILLLVAAIAAASLRQPYRCATRHGLVVAISAVALLLPVVVPLLPSAMSSPLQGLMMRKLGAMKLDVVEPNLVADTLHSRASPSTYGEPQRTDGYAPRVMAGRLALAALIGSLCFLTVRVRAAFLLLRLKQSGKRSPGLEHLATLLANGRIRPLHVLVVEGLKIPITFGVTPVIALPPEVEWWNREQQETVLLHELAHIQRGDVYSLWIIGWMRDVYWWNPLAWWLQRTAASDAEISADALALTHGARPATYAKRLIEIVRLLASLRAVPGAVAVTGSQLRRRIDALTEPRRSAGRVGRYLSLAMWLTVASGGLLVAGTLLPADISEVHAAADVEKPVTAAPPLNRAGRGVVAPVGPRPADGLTAARPGPERGLGSTDPRERERAFRTLAKMRDPSVGPVARRLLSRDDSSHVRALAALALGRSRDAAALAVLVDALRDESKHVRQAAAGALGDVGDRGALGALAGALNDPDDHVRQAAAESLGHIGSSAALPALIRASEDSDEHVRQAAVEALGDIGDPAAALALTASLSDPNAFVRRGARHSLERIAAR